MIRNLLTVPVTVSSHARYAREWIRVPRGLLRIWRLFIQQWILERKPGRPSKGKMLCLCACNVGGVLAEVVLRTQGFCPAIKKWPGSRLPRAQGPSGLLVAFIFWA
jgi:hypothetical protein